MRPLELRLKGLRSYHQERTIPLADESLLAIIGDTGAGKSSLLEAIVFALYAGSTWDGREASELISDRTRTMAVELSFNAEGESWRVRRTMSRGNRAAEHELVCTSNPKKPRADGARAVNREIEGLIGLTREQFCSAVLLPQGRFEQLLHAAPGARVDVLKGLLGLERLGRVREQADQLRQLLGERVIQIADRRAVFMSDPQAVADDARRRTDEIEPKAKRFSRARSELAKADEDARAKEDQAASLEQQAEGLEPRLTGDAAKLDRLEQRERVLAEQRKPLEDELQVTERELKQSSKLVEKAKHEQRDKVTLERGIDALDAAHAQLERLDHDRSQLDDRLAEAYERRTTLAEAEAKLPALETALGEATAAAESAATDVSREEERQAQLDRALEELESKLFQLQAAERQVADNEQAVVRSAEGEQHRRNDLDVAISARERAEAERDRLAALAPIASLAHECSAGDPCPVCQRELPDDFEPPSAEGLNKEAKAAYTHAQEAERAAEKAHADAGAQLKQLRDAQRALQEARTSASEEAANAEAAIRALSHDSEGFAGEILLARAREQAQATNGQLEQLRKAARAKATERDERKGDRDKLVSGIESDRKLLESNDSANKREQERIADDRRQILERIGKLRLPIELTDTPTTTQLAHGLAQLRQLLPAAEQLESGHAALLEQKKDVETKLGEVDEEFQREVREPVIATRAALEGLRGELERLCAPTLSEAPEVGAPTRQLAAWGEAVEKGVTNQLKSMRARAEDFRSEARAVRDGALAQLAGLGVGSREEFEGCYDDLRGELRLARRDLKQAEAQLAPVAKLDDLRKRTEAMRMAFADLYELLLDKNFVQYAVANRQRVMLAAASVVLQEVSGGHYGFSEDFRIVDNETGQQRAPRTLSGGESFLASLSLALGLVEATARSGGRLDALFLDEGFGSLDPNALQQSLDALERRAEAGRLVAVISHVPLVAEQIERVLLVTKNHEGSDVRFMTASERADMAFADAVESGV